MSELYWWGYIHINGHVQAKRFWKTTGKRDMDEARLSPFVVDVYGPFPALDRDDALAQIAECYANELADLKR